MMKAIAPERLLSKFKVGPGCWPWTAAKDRHGYGRVQSDGSKGTVLAHRAIYELLGASIPAERVLGHNCDIPSCVNPSHMFVGTMKDNQMDMARKQRHGGAKLDPDRVRRVRRLLALGVPQRTIASDLGVRQSQISSIKSRRTWAWVT